MQLGVEKHRGLEVGMQVEVTRATMVIWAGVVSDISPGEVTIHTGGSHQADIHLVFDDEMGSWKPVFQDMDDRLCVNKASPGLKIREATTHM